MIFDPLSNLMKKVIFFLKFGSKITIREARGANKSQKYYYLCSNFPYITDRKGTYADNDQNRAGR